MATAIFLRRRKLGMGSCHGIRRTSRHNIIVGRNDVRNRRGFPNADWIVRWGCTDHIPTGPRVIQPATAISQVNNKAAFRRTVVEADPELAPATWFDLNDNNITYPCIVRPGRHAQGKALWLCNNVTELRRAVARAQATRWGPSYYISALVDKVAEYRIFVVQGRVAAVAQKTPADASAIAWNVSQGGRFDNVRWDDWPLQGVRKAIQAMDLTSLDFGGVDVMTDREGKAYIIEINSAPSLPKNSDGSPTHRQASMARCFDYIMDNNSKDKIPLIEERGGYRKFIHPAVCDTAQLR